MSKSQIYEPILKEREGGDEKAHPYNRRPIYKRRRNNGNKQESSFGKHSVVTDVGRTLMLVA